MNALRPAVVAWRRFWFREAPLLDLAIARILVVAIVLYLDAGGRCLRNALLSPEHWMPIPFVQALGIGFPGVATLQWLDQATRAVLIAAGLGLLTNAALAAAFVLQLVQEGLVNSTGKITHATIPLLYAMLFLAVSPCGRRLSLDALLRRRWSRRSQAAEVPATVSRDAGWPLDLLFVELAAFYGQAGYSKLRASGLAWADGFTLQFYLLDKGAPAGMWLAEHLWLCTALSVAVLTFELSFPIAIVARRLRPWFLVGGAAFHLGTMVFLRIAFWPVVALYPLFLPWSRLLARRR